jgi:hypothetical protein
MDIFKKNKQIRKSNKTTSKRQHTATDQISTASCTKPNTTKQKQIKNHHKPNKKAGTTPADKALTSIFIRSQ